MSLQEGHGREELRSSKAVVQLEAVAAPATSGERDGRFAGTAVVDDVDPRGELPHSRGEEVDVTGLEVRRSSAWLRLGRLEAICHRVPENKVLIAHLPYGPGTARRAKPGDRNIAAPLRSSRGFGAASSSSPSPPTRHRQLSRRERVNERVALAFPVPHAVEPAWPRSASIPAGAVRYGGQANDREAAYLRFLAESGSAPVLPVLRTRGMARLGRTGHTRPCDREHVRRPARRGFPSHLCELRLHQAPVRSRAR